MGLPYEGEWTCFDEAFYVYLPTELTVEEITEKMQTEGIIAYYSSTNEQGVTLQIQIAKQGRKDSIEAILAEYQAFCDQAVYVTINGIPAVTAYSGNELYAEALMENGEAYLMKRSLPAILLRPWTSMKRRAYMWAGCCIQSPRRRWKSPSNSILLQGHKGEEGKYARPSMRFGVVCASNNGAQGKYTEE